MTKKIKITDQEVQEFRDSVKGVKPLTSDKVILRTKRVKTKLVNKPIAIEYDLDDGPIKSQVSAEEVISFKATGIQHRVMQKLKQGEFSIEAELDLHGKNILQAKHAIQEFIASCQSEHLQYLRIIHGKGSRQVESPAILKNQVNHWLRDHPKVLAFHSAKPKDGGAGALYVILKKNQEK